MEQIGSLTCIVCQGPRPGDFWSATINVVEILRNYWLHQNFIRCLVYIQSTGLWSLWNGPRWSKSLTLPRWQSSCDPVSKAWCCDRAGGDWRSLLSPKPSRIPFAQEEFLACKGQLGQISKKDVKLIGGNRMTGGEHEFMCMRACTQEGAYWLYLQFWSIVLIATDK